MYALLAAIPIIMVGVLMIGFMWPAMKAMPVGWISAVIIAAIWWDMPLQWLAGASIGGVIDAFSILIIVFGALLILQLLKASGGVESISYSIANVSPDRRVQALLIAFLMGAFFEGAAGFGTPAAVAAPFVGTLGAFISGSNTVSNIMFGAFQFETARAAGVEVIPTLGLQTAGAAGGNMLCIHNVVAAITTVGLIGKEGLVMRKTIVVTIIYALLIAILTTILINTVFAGIF